VLKRETHRQALVAAAISGNPKFFLGTDSAPHAQAPRRRPAAAPAATRPMPASNCMPRSSRRPERAGQAGRLRQLPSARTSTACRATPEKITLKREAQAVPASLDYLPGDRLVPLRAGESIAWQLA
jgi:dihydroorotase